MCETGEISIAAAVTVEGLCCQGFSVLVPSGSNNTVCCNVELRSLLDINNMPDLRAPDTCKSFYVFER